MKPYNCMLVTFSTGISNNCAYLNCHNCALSRVVPIVVTFNLTVGAFQLLAVVNPSRNCPWLRVVVLLLFFREEQALTRNPHIITTSHKCSFLAISPAWI